MSDIQKEVKEAITKATPGPWKLGPGCIYTNHSGSVNPVCVTPNNDNNAHLIANAPTWLLHQQELIDQLQQDNEKLSNLLHKANLNGWQKSTESIQEDTERLKLFSDALRQKDAEIARLREALEPYRKYSIWHAIKHAWKNPTDFGHNKEQNEELLEAYDVCRKLLRENYLSTSQMKGADTCAP